MTLDEFRERYDGAPLEYVEFAALIRNELDPESMLYGAAIRFLEAWDGFELALEDSDIQLDCDVP